MFDSPVTLSILPVWYLRGCPLGNSTEIWDWQIRHKFSAPKLPTRLNAGKKGEGDFLLLPPLLGLKAGKKDPLDENGIDCKLSVIVLDIIYYYDRHYCVLLSRLG